MKALLFNWVTDLNVHISKPMHRTPLSINDVVDYVVSFLAKTPVGFKYDALAVAHSASRCDPEDPIDLHSGVRKQQIYLSNPPVRSAKASRMGFHTIFVCAPPPALSIAQSLVNLDMDLSTVSQKQVSYFQPDLPDLPVEALAF